MSNQPAMSSPPQPNQPSDSSGSRWEEARLLFVPGLLVLAACVAFAIALLTLDQGKPATVKAAADAAPTARVAPPVAPSAPVAVAPSSARSAVRSASAPASIRPTTRPGRPTAIPTSVARRPVAVVVAGYRPRAGRVQIRLADQRAAAVAQRLLEAGWQVQLGRGQLTQQRATTVFYHRPVAAHAQRAASVLAGNPALRPRHDRLPGRGIFIVVLARG